MGQVTKYVGEYTLNQVDYPRREMGGYATNSYDIVCQVKKNGREVCHCTWHPDGTIHPASSCPCDGCSECLR